MLLVAIFPYYKDVFGLWIRMELKFEIQFHGVSGCQMDGMDFFFPEGVEGTFFLFFFVKRRKYPHIY